MYLTCCRSQPREVVPRRWCGEAYVILNSRRGALRCQPSGLVDASLCCRVFLHDRFCNCGAETKDTHARWQWHNLGSVLVRCALQPVESLVYLICAQGDVHDVDQLAVFPGHAPLEQVRVECRRASACVLSVLPPGVPIVNSHEVLPQPAYDILCVCRVGVPIESEFHSMDRRAGRPETRPPSRPACFDVPGAPLASSPSSKPLRACPGNGRNDVVLYAFGGSHVYPCSRCHGGAGYYADQGCLDGARPVCRCAEFADHQLCVAPSLLVHGPWPSYRRDAKGLGYGAVSPCLMRNECNLECAGRNGTFRRSSGDDVELHVPSCRAHGPQ